jgi:hypothetical protein
LCTECGNGLPVERSDKAAADTGARPIAIGAWEIRCPACGLVDLTCPAFFGPAEA